MDEAMAYVRALYNEHGPALMRYLKRLTGRSDLAEDLLQETFVQAMRGLAQLRKANSPKAWLFTIAHNQGLNALRRLRPTVPLSENITASRTTEEDPRPAQISKAIADLPEPQRWALQLRLEEQLSYEEIAGVLGIPTGTVRSRLHNAIKTLRTRLKYRED